MNAIKEARSKTKQEDFFKKKFSCDPFNLEFYITAHVYLERFPLSETFRLKFRKFSCQMEQFFQSAEELQFD